MAVALSGLAGGLAYRGYRQDVLGVRAVAVPLTELYFTDSQFLPANFTTGQTYHIPFTLVNHEGRDMDYDVQVVIQEGDHIQQLPTDAINLTPGASQTKEITFIPSQSKTFIKITVNIPNKQQHIRYMAETQ